MSRNQFVSLTFLHGVLSVVIAHWAFDELPFVLVQKASDQFQPNTLLMYQVLSMSHILAAIYNTMVVSGTGELRRRLFLAIAPLGAFSAVFVLGVFGLQLLSGGSSPLWISLLLLAQALLQLMVFYAQLKERRRARAV